MKTVQKEKSRKGLNGFVPLLPGLEKGVTRVGYSGERPVFQLLVGRELSTGKCVWIDSENHSSTYALADVAGGEALENVYIGRAFTPFQHHQLCMKIEEFLDEETEIIALPAVNGLYEDGQIKTEEAEELLEEALKHVKEVAEREGLKVMLSNSRKVEGELEYLTGVYSQDFLSAKETREGLKFSGREFETLIYPDSGVLQTTLPVWYRKGGEAEDGTDKRHVQAAPQ